MSENTKPSVGIKPWGSSKPKNRRQFDREDLPRLEYMKFVPGSMAELRVLTGCGSYYQARVKLPGSKSKYGSRVNTAYPQYDDCPVKNDLGVEPKERFKVIAIDRSSGTLKLVDISVLTQEQLESILKTKNKRRSDGDKVTPRDFDISITFNPDAASAAGFYTVSAFDNEPTSEEDLALIKDVGGEEVLDKILNKALLCPKPEWVRERLEALGWDGSPVVKDNSEIAETSETSEASEQDSYEFKRPSEAAAQ